MRPTLSVRVGAPCTATALRSVPVRHAWDLCDVKVKWHTTGPIFPVFTQRRSVAKSVACFQRRLFVCLCVCQHENFRSSKHRMMKLGVGALYKILAEFKCGGHSPRERIPKNVALCYDVGKISAGCLVNIWVSTVRSLYDAAPPRRHCFNSNAKFQV